MAADEPELLRGLLRVLEAGSFGDRGDQEKKFGPDLGERAVGNREKIAFQKYLGGLFLLLKQAELRSL